jgi:hypothetical protein
MKKQKLNYILEQVRKKGRGGDTILAHINPLEAKVLKRAGGSGTINPKTGLPEFKGGFISKNYWKKGAWKRDGAAIAGQVLGNMLLPGIGGTAGAGLGSAVGTKIRGRNDYGGHMLKSAALATAAPTIASMGGSAANAMGATNVGTALTNYGNTNAILPSIGLGEKTASAMGGMGTASSLANLYPKGKGSIDNGSEDNELLKYLKSKEDEEKNASFMDKLTRNSKEFLTKPKNLLSLGTTGLTLYDRMNAPKPKKELTPAEKGRAAKEEILAARLTPAEMAEQEQYELAMEKSRRRNSRKKFLPEERIDIEPMYNRVSSPQEYAQTGRWINYYNNPNFTGQPIRF